MSPTLSEGDEIMVHRGDAAARLRDGIYVLRRDDELLVKRVAVNPASRRVTLKSDNPAYPTWVDCAVEDLAVIGRVVWSAGRVS
jgi:phage repressor protein C with HTH and peptisase S24 domain